LKTSKGNFIKNSYRLSRRDTPSPTHELTHDYVEIPFQMIGARNAKAAGLTGKGIKGITSWLNI
jgi:hypothetical protein